MATQLRGIAPEQDPLDDLSLPGWLYFDPEFFEAEKKAFLRAAPQVVCHESEIPQPGRLAHDRISRRKRDRDPRRRWGGAGLLQRLSPSRIAAGRRQRRLRQGADLPLSCVELCAGRAPGRRAAPARISGPRTEDHGLFPVALENWRGFLFVTLEPGAPSVAEMMAPYEDEVAPYRFEELQAIGRVTLAPAAAQLEDHRRQLFGPSAHPRRSPRADAPVRP